MPPWTKGQNDELVRELCASAQKIGMKVRVGGGIRTFLVPKKLPDGALARSSLEVLLSVGESDSGFLRAAREKSSSKTDHHRSGHCRGNINIHCWRTRIRFRPKMMTQLEPFCAGFLCTDVGSRRHDDGRKP